MKILKNAKCLPDIITVLSLQVSHSIPEMERSEYRVADPDTNLLYVFDGNGRHLQTDNVITGATMYTFSYSTKGKLITVSDVNRNDLIIDYSKVRGYCFTH